MLLILSAVKYLDRLYTSGSQPRLWELHAALKYPLCSSQQSFNNTSTIFCNRLPSTIKQMCQLTFIKFVWCSS